MLFWCFWLCKYIGADYRLDKPSSRTRKTSQDLLMLWYVLRKFSQDYLGLFLNSGSIYSLATSHNWLPFYKSSQILSNCLRNWCIACTFLGHPESKFFKVFKRTCFFNINWHQSVGINLNNQQQSTSININWHQSESINTNQHQTELLEFHPKNIIFDHWPRF